MNLRTLVFPLLICAVFLPVHAIAQQAVINLTGGFSSNSLIRFTTLDGGGGYEGKGAWHSGISFNRKVSGGVWLGGGIVYEHHHIEITPEYFPGMEMVSETETIQLFSVPLEVRFEFLKVLFFNTGPSFDFDISKGRLKVDSQSGIGWSAGFGAGIKYRKTYFMLNPSMKLYSLIAFKHEQYHQHLFEAGLNLGIGYIF